ncbi:hypothetical protein [Mesorhizobium sp. M0701]|uniref:hypothetical protein n=1 Tax=Mesorhizobium sp. M0701 TaxID=2956989 RepID=UPI003339DE2A
MALRVERQRGGIPSGVVAGIVILGVCFLSLVCGELFCRYYLGLGTPPLSISDPKIEYLFAPDQDVFRFGNRVVYNHWSMRNEEFPEQPPLDQVRTMVIGDSVVNGGSLSDQSRLATTILTDDKNLYLNVSAGSWGPANELAYIRKFGFFDAKALIVVLSGHDASDLPTFTALDPNVLPQETPWLAINEAFERYLPRYLPGHHAVASILDEAPKHEMDLSPLQAMIELAQSKAISVCVVLHHTRLDRRAGVLHQGLVAIRYVAEARNVAIVDDKTFLDPDTSYRDDIHLNDKGQREEAEAFLSCKS